MTLSTITTDIGIHLVFRTFDYDKVKMVKKLLSLACLSDRHEYCSLRFVGATGCKCTCHSGNQ